MRVTVIVSVPPVSCQSSSLPPPSGSVGLGAASRFERVRELDAINQLVLQARAFADVELVAVAIAGAKALIALAGLVQRVEIHDQVEFVVRAVRHPGIGVGVVGARLVEDRERFAVARCVSRGCKQRGRSYAVQNSFHVRFSVMFGQ